MLTIGLTGGIGSGKSTIAKILENFGAEVVYADKIGHEVILPYSEAWKEIIERFGRDILKEDETIDRKRLGEIVFNNKDALSELNKISHPRISKRLKEEIYKRRDKKGVLVIEAALLIEANWFVLVDQVWVVIADRDKIFNRLRDRFTHTQIKARISSQMSNDERMKYADVVIDNSGKIEETRVIIDNIWRKIERCLYSAKTNM
jgi:dephospho-CoA kinase